jgi:hypothetical protein
VKHFRLWLLLLLAVLLPVRGALAAAMFCAPAGVGTQDEVRVLDHSANPHALMDAAMAHAGHDHAAHDHGTGTDGGESLNAHDKCNLCTAFCSVTPLASGPLIMTAPQDVAAAAFPELFAPPSSFLSDGQDRPPRSI